MLVVWSASCIDIGRAAGRHTVGNIMQNRTNRNEGLRVLPMERPSGRLFLDHPRTLVSALAYHFGVRPAELLAPALHYVADGRYPPMSHISTIPKDRNCFQPLEPARIRA